MKDTTVSATLDKWTHLWSRGDGAEAGSCSLSARYKITPRICEMSSEENSILTVPTTDGIAPRSMEICRELRGTVSCAAVSNKTAAFYCFMFPEAKKQQDLIKFTPDFSWRVLE